MCGASWEDYDDLVLRFSYFILKDKDILERRGSVKTIRLMTLGHAMDPKSMHEDILTRYEGAWLDNLEVPP